VLEAHVAEADRRDQPVVAAEIIALSWVIEERVRPARAHEPKVDGREPVDAEAAQVVFDAAAQLLRLIGAEDAAASIAAGAYLGDDDSCGG
jgi:hypothetical protein